MERAEVLEKVTEIARDVFENEDVVLTESSTAADVEEWDSLTHLSLISDIEEEFEINFTLGEISGSKNLGELITALMKHLDEK
jgi:acyl carrier protein